MISDQWDVVRVPFPFTDITGFRAAASATMG